MLLLSAQHALLFAHAAWCYSGSPACVNAPAQRSYRPACCERKQRCKQARCLLRCTHSSRVRLCCAALRWHFAAAPVGRCAVAQSAHRRDQAHMPALSFRMGRHHCCTCAAGTRGCHDWLRQSAATAGTADRIPPIARISDDVQMSFTFVCAAKRDSGRCCSQAEQGVCTCSKG